MAAVTITGQNLESTINAGGIVVLDFWASWCGPCRAFAPTFEAAAGRHPDLVFGKVDTEAEQQLAGALQIEAIPTLMVFRDKVLLYREAGALPPGQLEQLIQQIKGLDMEHVRSEIAKQEEPGVQEEGEA